MRKQTGWPQDPERFYNNGLRRREQIRITQEEIIKVVNQRARTFRELAALTVRATEIALKFAQLEAGKK